MVGEKRGEINKRMSMSKRKRTAKPRSGRTKPVDQAMTYPVKPIRKRIPALALTSLSLNTGMS
jgi:hypothetical protein